MKVLADPGSDEQIGRIADMSMKAKARPGLAFSATPLPAG